ncbi:surface antigen [Plasmodium falciparum UGT5.1]|uniref:Surface antigen n=1 Tax=Plasmodium falciparum UGT5.1 TaxID=1237627 RepID=W7JCL0_PLAFA|nr:surface antigen [Plasmodium falciparum UGT5.1]
MKRVMQQFEDRTSQRFHEYDERMQGKRQKCKEQCDKEIQKIVLKDKIDKELTEKFATLQTDIQSDSIPTCVCEKSLADKVEKECLKCAQNLGGMVAPSSGVLLGIAEGALIVWKDGAIIAAKDAAIAKGLALGKIAGDIEGAAKVIAQVESQFRLSTIGVKELGSVINVTNYTDVSNITTAIYNKFQGSCFPSPLVSGASPGRFSFAAGEETFCNSMLQKILDQATGSQTSPSTEAFIKKHVASIVKQAKTTAGATAETVTKNATTTLTAKNTGEL